LTSGEGCAVEQVAGRVEHTRIYFLFSKFASRSGQKDWRKKVIFGLKKVDKVLSENRLPALEGESASVKHSVAFVIKLDFSKFLFLLTEKCEISIPGKRRKK
jgi:hypothetical protein